LVLPDDHQALYKPIQNQVKIVNIYVYTSYIFTFFLSLFYSLITLRYDKNTRLIITQ